MNNRYIAIILAAVATTAAAAGGIEDVLCSIERNNSAIKAATASLHADSIAISASNNLEDPTVDFEYNFGKIGDKWAIGVSQGFDWPGAYSARGRANRDRIKALGSAMLTQRLEVLYNAKNLCLNVVYTNRQIEAQRLILNNVNELYDKYSKAFEHGEASIIDLNKLKIERIAARQALDELEVKLATLKAELKGLNNNSDFATVSLDALTAYPADDLAPIDEYEQAFAAFDPQNAYFMYSGEAIKSDVRASKRTVSLNSISATSTPTSWATASMASPLGLRFRYSPIAARWQPQKPGQRPMSCHAPHIAMRIRHVSSPSMPRRCRCVRSSPNMAT